MDKYGEASGRNCGQFHGIVDLREIVYEQNIGNLKLYPSNRPVIYPDT